MRRALLAVLAGLSVALVYASPVALAQDAVTAARQKEGIGAFVAALLVAVVTLVLSLFLAMWAVKVAITLYDRWTKDIDELEEIRKGNLAVGILMAGIIYSVANIITSGVVALTTAIKPPPIPAEGAAVGQITAEYAVGVIVGVVNLVVSLALATFAINMAMRFLNRFTKDMDELKEVAKGNTAVALLMASVLISVSSVVQAGVAGISQILDPHRVAGALGLGG